MKTLINKFMKSSLSKSIRSMKKHRSRLPRVLVVDDEEVMGYLIRRVVDSLGYELDWVRDCETALKKMKRYTYDVIVSDYRLPGMTGETFYDKILDFNAELVSKMIFITGDTVSRQTISFFKKIRRPYFAKPFEIDALKNAIQEVIDSNKSAS